MPATSEEVLRLEAEPVETHPPGWVGLYLQPNTERALTYKGHFPYGPTEN